MAIRFVLVQQIVGQYAQMLVEFPDAAGHQLQPRALKDKALIVAIRLYGVGTEFYDKTWKPDDVVKMK